MTQEERSKRIKKIIERISSENTYITQSQISRAKSLYQYDLRPIEEIEKELLKYSEDIRISATERENKEQTIVTKKEVFGKDTDKPSMIQSEDGVDQSKLDATHNDGFSASSESSGEQIELDVESPVLFAQNQSQSSQADELTSMLSEALAENSFVEAAPLIEQQNPKVLTKDINSNGYPNIPKENNSTEGGFSMAGALLTISILFSIMGIIISLLILYTT